MIHTLSSPDRRLTLFASLALSALIAASPALGQIRHEVHVPAGPLDAALMTLAAQSHEQLLYTPSLVAGRTSPAVDGDLTAEQALARMLAASGILVSRTGPSMLVLRAPGATKPLPLAAQRGGTAAADTGPDRPFVADRQEAGAGAPPAVAAQMPGGPAAPGAATVSEIEVTGSHIRGAAAETPLLVMSRADIDRSGQSTVAGALTTLPQNFGGGAAEGSSSTGADRVGHNGAFGTGINLHGLGNNATLVLVNGRRIAGSGSFGDFVDVSTIPSAAVDRVEVLLDGASAIYGSDAVGGVINIILRKTYDGAETRLMAGSAAGQDGTPREGQFAQTFGRRWTGGGLLVSLELDRRDALNDADRSFAASADLRPFGGADHRQTNAFPGNILAVNPATGVLGPAFAIPGDQSGVGLQPSQLRPGVVNLWNQRLGTDLLPRQTTGTLYVAADQDIGGGLEVSADARYGHRRYRLQLANPVSQLTVTRANPFYVAPSGAASESIAYDFADLPFPVQTGYAETITTTVGAKLQLPRDWQASGYLAFGQEMDVGRSSGNLQITNLNEALGTIADQPGTPFSTAANGFYNPFAGVVGANSPAVLAFIGAGSTYIRNTDRVYTANLQADGALWSLPGGPLKLAVGAQVRRETFTRGGANFVTGLAPTPAAGLDAARNVSAAYAELRAPIFGPDNAQPGLERLDLSIAGRVEQYESIGSTANPKIGVWWQPLEGLHLRGTYGTSFRAPALRELHDTAAFSPALLNQSGALIRVLELGGGNPALKPETARSYSLGLDVAPPRWPGAIFSLSWFKVRYSDRIDRPVLANVLGALSDPTLSHFVTRIDPAHNAADLARITALLANPATSTLTGVFPPTAYGAIVETGYVNTATLNVEGFDMSAAYRIEVGGDQIALATNATYMLDYQQQVTPTSPLVQKVGVAGFPVRVRSRTTIDWSRGRLGADLALNYVSAYHDPLGTRIGAQPTVDLQLRLAAADTGVWRGVTASLNVRNLFDRAPPFYDNPFGVGFDPTNAEPIGRFVFVQLTRAW
jgi:iron complex outermembrane receptor protein